jgi:hypothetical protein
MEMRVENSKEWFTLSLRVILVLLIPTALNVELTEDRIAIYTSCILGGDYPRLLTELFSGHYVNPAVLIVAFIVIIPSILYSFELGRRPLDKSTRGLTLWAMLSTFVLSFLYQYIVIIGSIIGAPVYELSLILGQIFPLAVTILIILPLMLREVVIRSCPEELLSMSLREVERIPHLNLLRNKAITTAIWAMLTFAPFIIYTEFDVLTGGVFDTIGIIYQTMFRIYSYLRSTSVYLNAQIYPFPIYLWIMLLMSSIRLLFVREIYRWLANESSWQRLIMLGVLGELLPSGIVSSTYIINPGAAAIGFYLPFPLVLLMGLASLKLYKFTIETTTIWDDEEAASLHHEFPYQKSVRRGSEDEIRVPLLYLIRSKIAGLSKRLGRNSSCEDAESGGDSAS